MRVRTVLGVWLGMSAGMLAAQKNAARQPVLPREAMATGSFGADASWYLKNIPFLEIDDREIQQIYFYRWKVFRSHIREIGQQGTTVLEFLEDVPWAREPYTDLNDSASFHLMEGRWLRDPRVVNDLVDHLYAGGGNDRHFSESIAAATESTARVTGDWSVGVRHLDTMQHVFNLWDDHFDPVRGLYWVEPIRDATEYTIASIDASGAGFTETPSTDQNRNGFTGGFAFRPSINSYQYGNALAIARFANVAGRPEVAKEYAGRAEKVRAAVMGQLWNPGFAHFVDRYQRSTATVKAGEFIRGRELVGFVPWLYELPPKEGVGYGKAWLHALAPAELGGTMGLRTVEPSYARYMTQYRYDKATGLRECQWNGPSWPFQTSQALTGMANLLDDYPAGSRGGVTGADYLRLLRQYTHQHYLSAGHPDLQEDYDPDKGGPIVGLPRSHHYEHSTYVDLVLSGLVGLRPREDEVLEIDPLVAPAGGTGGARPIRYFAVEGIRYHGNDVGLVYDADGSRYGIGTGLSVFVAGKRVWGPGPLGHTVVVGALRPAAVERKTRRVDLAVNVGVPDGPRASASSNMADAKQANDGRMWFFPEVANGWSPAAWEADKESWWAVDFGSQRRVGRVELAFLDDGERFGAPAGFRLERRTAAGWEEIAGQARMPVAPLAGGENVVEFPAVAMRELRVVLTRPAHGAGLRMIEVKAFAP